MDSIRGKVLIAVAAATLAGTVVGTAPAGADAVSPAPYTSCSDVAGNLVQNCSFDGPLSQWSFAGGALIPSGGFPFVHSGHYEVAFSNDGSVAQQISGLAAGHTYVLGYWLRNLTSTPNHFAATVNDSGGGSQTFDAQTDAAPYEWTYFQDSFVADGPALTLRFAGGNTNAFPNWLFLDDISLTDAGPSTQNTAPQVSVTGVTDGASYEFGAVPVAGCSATDAEDGPSSPAATLSAITGPRAAAGLGSQTASCSYTDSGGLIATASATYSIVDTTAPALTVPAAQNAVATASTGAVVSYPSPSAFDAVDGAVTPVCDHSSGDLFPLGQTTVSCVATDIAGNATTKTFTVTVTYSWSGALQPINAGGTSIFKLGSTVPVKFSLTGASAGIGDAVATLSYTKVNDGIEGSTFEAVSTAAASTGNQFRYDATAGQYVFNWSTKGLTSGTYKLIVTLGDGIARSVVVSLK